MKIPEIVMLLVKKNTANIADDDNPIKEKFKGPAELKYTTKSSALLN